MCEGKKPWLNTLSRDKGVQQRSSKMKCSMPLPCFQNGCNVTVIAVDWIATHCRFSHGPINLSPPAIAESRCASALSQ